MKEKIRKIIAFILTVIITMSATLNSTKVVDAATFDEINQTEVFLKQNTNYTCTLVSAVMMVRRAAMATGNSNWKNITESTMRGTAWLEETGLSWSFSYAGITVKHDYLSGGSGNINQLISLLKTHPEGIVIYDSDVPHAILITDYTNGTFYCADPGKNIASGRIPVSSAYISVTNADAYWYVSSPAVTVTNTITLWGVDEGKVVDVPQYLWAKRFDDDSNHFAEFYMDGNLLTGYLTADENGYYSVWIDPQDYTEGNHTFSVKYFNTNGSWTDSRTICIVSDKVAPDASEKKISLWGIDEGKIVDVPQYLWAKRFDDDSNHFAEFYMDGNLLTGHLTADENGYYSVWIEPQDYADGNHIFSVKYFNTNGSWTDSRTICIVPDTEPPVITNVKVTDVTSEGYIVTCNVTDDKCLNRVQFPTWSLKNGQDDLIEDWWSNPTVSGTMNGSQVTFRVNISEHNNESGEYATHIYAIDSYANRTTYEFIVTVPETEVPTPTETEVVTPTSTETEEVIPIPTETEVITPTPTETEEVTPIPTATEEVTPTPTETEVVTPTPTPTKSVIEIFTDVYDDWYTSYVQYVFDHGLMTGIKGTTEFQPNANITKAQVAQVLYNMENQPTVNDKKAFTDLRDVYAAEWYANAVAWAYNTGVVTGDLNTKKFSPNANVTREQLALMMYRYASYKKYDVTATDNLAGLKNAEHTSDWALAGVKWAVGAGLISGVEKNGVKDLQPQGNASRAQMAAILKRFCEAQEVNKYITMADSRKEEIRASANDSMENITGTVYYVSNSGSDSNNGLSPETAWATPQYAFSQKLQSGDAVLLERDGSWNIEPNNKWGLTSSALVIPNGVTLGAYGDGKKPVLRGDMERANSKDFWELYSEQDGTKIWKAAQLVSYSPVIVFNEGEAYASPVMPGMNGSGQYLAKDGTAFDVASGLDQNLQFCCLLDLTKLGININIENNPDVKGELYLRCDAGNPAEVYESIHIPQTASGLCLQTGVTLDNLSLRYFSCNGAVLDGYDGFHSRNVTNCEVGWCGGLINSYQENELGVYIPFAAGGALQCSSKELKLMNNYIHHCGPFTLIFSIHHNPYDPDLCILRYENIYIANNLIEYCGSGIHMGDYAGMDIPGTKGYISNFVFENNFVMNSGMGWVRDTISQYDGSSSPFLSVFENTHGAIENDGIHLRNNVFCKGAYSLFSLWDYHMNGSKIETLPVFTGNTYIQTTNQPILQKNWATEVYYPSDEVVKEILGDKTGNLMIVGE